MSDHEDIGRAPTQHPYDRRVADRELHDLRERLTSAEREIKLLSGAMYGSPTGLGLQHKIDQLTSKLDQLIKLDAERAEMDAKRRLPRWAVLVLWLAALAIGAVIAWASLGGAGG